MAKTVVVFADGENLVLRYQAMMRENGRRPFGNETHIPDCFVWSPRIASWSVFSGMDVARVNYYTHVQGDDEKVRTVEQAISRTTFPCPGVGTAQLIPRVRKKLAASRKVKVMDIDITMDIMRAALTMPIDGILLLSGDGDYVRLLREITRTTSKQVYVGAFSSGLAPELRQSAEAFVDLDDVYFEPL